MPKPVKQTPTVKKSSPKTGFASKLHDIEFEEEGIKINLYGKSGSGKTTLWSSFPGKIVALICSGKGELRSIDTPEMRKKVKTYKIESSEEITECVEWLKSEDTGYNTVVLDHLTRYQDLILKEILGLSEIPEQKSWGLASQQDYGQCALQFKERISGLLSLKQNVVLVAQERDFNTDQESDILMPYVASSLSPSIVGWLNPACDYICNTFLQGKTAIVENKVAGKVVKMKKRVPGTEYCLRVAPNEVYTTKFRIPKGRKFPDYIVDPTYEKIMKLIKGE
jgi:phage nucleotide-binding protein